MDTAHCTVNNQTYLALNFALLQPAEKAQKRHALICPECDVVAYFRKASKSGQAACFGARHAENCSLTASKYEQNSIGLGDDQNILENSGQHIILDLNFGAVDDRHNDQDAPPNAGGRGGRFTAHGEQSNAVMHRRLSTILTNLVTSNQFRASQQIIEIPGSGEFTVKDFFVQLKDARSTHINQYRGYWGKIVTANSNIKFGNGALWLNSGNSNDISICIPEPSIRDLYERFRISNIDELKERHTLVIGTLVSSPKGKRYIKMTDLEHLTIK